MDKSYKDKEIPEEAVTLVEALLARHKEKCQQATARFEETREESNRLEATLARQSKEIDELKQRLLVLEESSSAQTSFKHPGASSSSSGPSLSKRQKKINTSKDRKAIMDMISKFHDTIDWNDKEIKLVERMEITNNDFEVIFDIVCSECEAHLKVTKGRTKSSGILEYNNITYYKQHVLWMHPKKKTVVRF